MPNNDGTVFIEVDFDTTPMQKGAKVLENSLKSAIGIANTAFGKASASANQYGAQLDKLSAKLQYLNDKLAYMQEGGAAGQKLTMQINEQLAALKQETDEYKQMEAAAGELAAKMREIAQAQGKSSAEYKETEGAHRVLTQEMGVQKQKIDEINQSLETMRDKLYKAKMASIQSPQYEKLKNDIALTEKEQQRLLSTQTQSTKQVQKTGTAQGKMLSGLESGFKRLKSIVAGAFFFNIISKALTGMTQAVGRYVQTNKSFMQSLQLAKGNLLTAFQPIWQVITPAINALGKALAYVTGLIASFAAVLSGKSLKDLQSQAKALDKNATAIKGVSKATDKAKKSADKATASFDTLNILQSPTDESEDSGSGSGSTSVGSANVPETAISAAFPDEMQAQIDKLTLEPSEITTPDFKSKIQESIQNEDWSTLGTTLATAATDSINTGLQSIDGTSFGNTLGAVFSTLLATATTFVTTLDWGSIPKIIGDVLSGAASSMGFDNLSTSLDGLFAALSPFSEGIGSGLDWLLENVFNPLGTWVSNNLLPSFLDLLTVALDLLNVCIEALKPYAQWLWDEWLEPLAAWTADAIVSAIDSVRETFQKLLDLFTGKTSFQEFLDSLNGKDIIIIAIATAIGAVVAIVTAWNVISAIATGITSAFGVAMNILTAPITWVIIAIAALVAGIIILVKNWDKVKETAQNVWDKIKECFGKIGEWFNQHVVDPLKNVFNSIIGFFEGVANRAIKAVNNIIKAINKISFDVPDWVPVIGGKKFGFNLKEVKEITLPRLATGAVIPPNREFLAVLGDQKRGTNIEAPLDTIVEAFQRVQNNGGNDINIKFSGNEGQLLRYLFNGLEVTKSKRGLAFTK